MRKTMFIVFIPAALLLVLLFSPALVMYREDTTGTDNRFSRVFRDNEKFWLFTDLRSRLRQGC
jgi:hypothetical protein